MTDDGEGHRLFCYTKSCFFGKDTWDDVTKTHRGKLYYENKPVNHPFTKIFNVDEVTETEHNLIYNRMQNEPYEILDKANGHLFIVSMFQDSKGEQHVVFSTKGSMPNPENDLLNDDIRIFAHKYSEQLDKLCFVMPNVTLMFEAIVAHDKHSMYDLQVEQYGSENDFVLLGAAINLGREHIDLGNEDELKNIQHSEHNTTTLADYPWVESDWHQLLKLSHFIGCPVVHCYDFIEGSPETWKEHTDREGYVIRFLTDNARVKIKTTEYWKNRFKKDLTPEVLLSTFAKGGAALMQEKIANKCIAKIESYFISWYMDDLIRWKSEVLPYLKQKNNQLSSKDRKWLFTESYFCSFQRQYIAAIVDGKNLDITQNKTLRQMFVDDVALERADIKQSLEQIVVNAL
jgi:hypothetical protein